METPIVVLIVIGIIVTLWSLPFVFYLCAKLGVVGYLSGKRFFERSQSNQEIESDEKE